MYQWLHTQMPPETRRPYDQVIFREICLIQEKQWHKYSDKWHRTLALSVQKAWRMVWAGEEEQQVDKAAPTRCEGTAVV